MRRSNARTLNRGNNHRNPTRMDLVKFQFRSGRPGFKNPYKHNFKSHILLAIALFIALMFSNKINRNYEDRKYGIVIDGGSTGTRIHVFKYKVKDGILMYDFGKNGLSSLKVNPGLSAYEDEPERAGEAVAELVEFGRRRVPREHWGETEIRLMATAGMRMLRTEVQERILEACRRVLKSSRFRFRDDWASVISGSDEGVYAWVIANYALGTLGGDPRQTTGIIELGGASAQCRCFQPLMQRLYNSTAKYPATALK